MRRRPRYPTRVSDFARPGRALLAALLALASRSAIAASTGPYDLSAADALLQSELPDLQGHVAVLVRQNGKEIYRFQAGDIGYDTKIRMASFTKTVSAAVILALRDEGLLSLEERLGSALPKFESHGLGAPTILDAWGMRHGIDSAVPYEIDARFTLAESVDRLATFGYLAYSPPGSQLGYLGAGMQAVGRIAELRAGDSWEEIARSRILDPCGMPQTDFGEFAPNPSLPGGLRSTPEESMRFAQMVIDGGWSGSRRVLSDASIEQLFTNSTRALPVFASPWPATHPLYPYGTDPDYGFGDWVIAEDPATRQVEEIVGAGAWGSYIWIDRRRGVTAVLFTDVAAGSQASLDSALGLFDVVRRQLEATQVAHLAVAGSGTERSLSWLRPAAATATRLYGSNHPIRSIYDLRAARLLLETSSNAATVPVYPYYAATAILGSHENTALVPGGNALTESAGGRQWVPVASHSPGAQGSAWRTDLALLNAGSSERSATVTFHAPQGPVSRDIVVMPGAQLLLPDVVAFLGAEGSAPLSVATDGALEVSSRTFSPSAGCLPSGSLGLALPTLADGEGLLAGSPGLLPQLREDAAFRTNVTFVCTGAFPALARLRLYDDSGAELAAADVSVPASGFLQLDRPFASLASRSDLANAWGRVEVLEGGPLLAFATVIDNATNDPLARFASPEAALASAARIPMASHSSGAQGSSWRTDLGLLNPGSVPRSATVSFLTEPPASRTFSVPPGSQLVLTDVVASLGASGSAPLRVDADGPLAVSSRTYSPAGSCPGSLGLALPTLVPSDGLADGASARLSQLREDAAFRTNVTFVNAGSLGASARLRLYDDSGSELASTEVSVAVSGFLQLDRPFASLASRSDLGSAWARVDVLSGGPLLVFATVIDNATNDPLARLPAR